MYSNHSQEIHEMQEIILKDLLHRFEERISETFDPILSMQIDYLQTELEDFGA